MVLEPPLRPKLLAHLSTAKDRMVRLEIQTRLQEQNLGRFRLEQSELADTLEWKQVYLGRDAIQTVFNLIPKHSFCFRACRINSDGLESDWSDTLVVKIPPRLVCRPKPQPIVAPSIQKVVPEEKSVEILKPVTQLDFYW